VIYASLPFMRAMTWLYVLLPAAAAVVEEIDDLIGPWFSTTFIESKNRPGLTLRQRGSRNASAAAIDGFFIAAPLF